MASVRQLTTPNREGKRPWVVEYTDPAGKRRRATPKSGLKRDADKLRLKIEVEIERGEHLPESRTVTVSEALDLWLGRCDERVKAKDRMRARTLRNFRSWSENHIRPKLGTALLTSVTVRSVQAWVDGLAYDRSKPRGRPTIENSLVCLRLMLKHAHQQGLVGRDVLKGEEIRVPGRAAAPVAVPDKDEIRALLEASDRSTMGGPAPYLRPFLYVATFAGLRLGEIRALTWENVDFTKGLIRVRVAADNYNLIDAPKTESSIRDVPIAATLSTEMKRWHMACGRPATGLVFQGRNGRIVAEASVTGSWVRLQHRVFGDGSGQTKRPRGKYHFHALRHVCASLLIESGLPAKRVQYIMGHTSIQMTFDRYGHLFDDPALIAAAMEKIGNDLVPLTA